MQDTGTFSGSAGFTKSDDRDALALNLINRVSVGDITTRAADVYGARPAIIEGSRSFTFSDFDDLANRIGSGLLSLGLSKGDVIGVMSRNCTEALACYFACAKAGLIFCPINLGLRTEEIIYCLNDAKARVLIAQHRFSEQAAALSRNVESIRHLYWIEKASETDHTHPGPTLHDLSLAGSNSELEVLIGDRDPVQLLYTSGTTSRPKGVLTSHLAVTMTALSSALVNRMTPESPTLMTLPLYHCALLNGRAVPAMAVGATAVLTDGFQEVETADLIERHEITTLVLLPMMYQGLLSHPETAQRRFPTVSRACYAMTPMPEERLKAIRWMFPNADVVLGAGQTEFTPPATYQQPTHQWEKASSWGPPTPLTRAAIMDDNGELL
ncbi:MAG: AMP-binding protein, partial [Ectothiorhodospiraceae bacterium]|nr:AMP-binding protein [Ectothiorhodospiraceae bacterium]